MSAPRRVDRWQQAEMSTAVSATARDVIGLAAVSPTGRIDGQTATYRQALQEAREQFRASTERHRNLRSQLVETENEIARLRRAITALSAMCSEHSMLDDLGITDAVKEVMANERTMLSTIDVIQKLADIGFDIRSQKNVQASVHTILQRLARRDLIVRVEGNGKAVMWKGPKFDQRAPNA